ncbi:MAG: glycosyltransferase [Desulforegulaceae bacterium]|nr:glycosyltransferase [Desulforegulaceae bacterium]
MIKICFVINNLKMGGAERQFLELLKGLNKKDFDVSLYLYAENEPLFYNEIYNIEGIKIHREKVNSKFKVLKIFKATFNIRKFIKTNKFDLIQTSLVMNGALVRLAALGIPHYKNKIITSIRKNFDKYPLYEKIIESVLLINSYTITNTNYSAEKFKNFLKGYFNNKILYIYNGFNTKRFLKKKYEPRNTITIGSVGRMTKEKNHIQILRVLSSLEKSFEVFIIGDLGTERIKLDNYKDKNLKQYDVKIMSHIHDIENYYKKMDIFILPSLYEGCPNVLFEAMLSGCFCIISENANTDDFIVNGVNGLVYDNTDSGLKKCIEETCELYPTDEGKKIIDNGYLYAKENFSIEKMINSYDFLYKKILN